MNIILLFLIIPFSVSSAFGEASSKYLNLYKTKNYSEVISSFAAEKDESTLADEKILLMVASSSSQMGQEVEAIRLRSRLIRERYASENTKVVKARPEDDLDDISKNLKIIYFYNFKDISAKILKSSSTNEKDLEYFHESEKILEKVEYRISDTEKISKEVLQHLSKNVSSPYLFEWSVFAGNFFSQNFVKVVDTNGDSFRGISSNKVFCTGASVSLVNNRNRFFTDACFMYGAGTFSVINESFSYSEKNLPLTGIKASLAWGRVISESGVEVGLKVPIIAQSTQFSKTSDSTSGCAGCTKTLEDEVQILSTIYTRFPYRKVYLDTEFGKPLGIDTFFWGLYLGYKF